MQLKTKQTHLHITQNVNKKQNPGFYLVEKTETIMSVEIGKMYYYIS